MEGFRKCVTAIAILCICAVASCVDATTVARVVPRLNSTLKDAGNDGGHLAPFTVLTYHNGSLLTAVPVTPIYLIWYGDFSQAQRNIIEAFFLSFSPKANVTDPSILSWWSMTSGYTDTNGTAVSPSLAVAGEVSFAAEINKTLVDRDILALVVRALKKLPTNANAIYAVLTAEDVKVEEFCSSACAAHFASDKAVTNGKRLPYIWVGNPGKQCPSLCSWPFAKAEYGPQGFVPLVPPNDVGVDGLLISLASILAGTVTNPFDTGYYQGPASAPLEAATACPGIFGYLASPGYPGILLRNWATNASFNTYGVNKTEFLMPALWRPSTSLCSPP